MRQAIRKPLASIMILALLFSLFPAVTAHQVYADAMSDSSPVYRADFEPNGGFEAFGGASTLSYSTEQAHSGQQSLKVSNVGQYAGVKLGLKGKYVEPGKLYTVSMSVYQANGGLISLERLIDHKTNGWQQDAIAGWRAVNSSQDGWVRFEGTLSTENIVFEDTWDVGVTVKAQIASDQSFYIDDVRLEEVSGVVYQTGFELYNEFEAFGGNSTLAYSTEQAFSGQQSLKVSDVGMYAGVQLKLKDKYVQPDKKYRVSVSVYQADGGQLSFERLIDHKTEGWKQEAIAGWRTINSSQDGWVKLEGTLSTENIVFDDTWGIGVTIKAQIAADQSFYIDDFRLVEIGDDGANPANGLVLDYEVVADLSYFNNRAANGAVFEQSTEQFYQNAHSMKVTNRAGRHDGPEINLNASLVPGKSYSISAYVYQNSGQTQSMEFNQDGMFLASANAASGAWTKLAIPYYVAKASGNVMNIQSWNAVEPTNFDFYVDLLEVTEVAARPVPQPKVPTPLPIPDELPAPTIVGVNTHNEHQTINGFGTSFHWYSDMAVKHPYRDELYDYMFEQTGINIIRLFNLYGYDDGQGGRWGIDRPLDELEIYQLVEQGRAHLDDPDELQLIIAAWSPPAYLKSNDQTSGTGKATLKRGDDGEYMYEEYAQYWVDAVKAYRDAGMEPDYITLQNELDIEVSYEGMEFAPTETASMAGYDKALTAVYEALQAAYPGHDYKITGPESFSAEIGATTKYTDVIDLGMLDAISHHLYSGGTADDADTFVGNLRAFNKKFPDMPKMQTEFFTSDPIETAKVIHNFLVEEEGDTYLVWNLVWDHPSGVISIESPYRTEHEWENYHGYLVTDRYYAMNHYSKFIKHGYKRIDSYMNADALDLRISAYKSPDEQEIVTVLINGSGENRTAQLDLHGYQIASSEVYRTSYSEEADNPHERVKNIGALAEGNTVYLPAGSIATVVVKGTPGGNPKIISPAIPQFFNPPDTYSPRGPVYAPNGTPTIDGDFDAAVYTADPLNVNMLVDAEEQTIDGEGTARTWLAWDDGYLYAYADVTDSTPHPGSWDKDNLELFLNETGIRHRDYTQADYQYRFNAANAPVEYGGGSSQSYLQNVSYLAKPKEDGSGYIVEAKLAFNFGKPYDGKVINVDVQLADDKTGSGRETIVHWADPKSSTYMDLSRLGYVILMDEYDEARFESLKGQLTSVDPQISEYVRDGLIIGGYYEGIQDQTVKTGKTAVFEVKVHTTEATTVSYQWQVWDGVSWVNVPEANAATLTIKPVKPTMDGNLYRCIMTSTKDGMMHQAMTDAASLTVLKGSEPDKPPANPSTSTSTTTATSALNPLTIDIQDQLPGEIRVKVKTAADVVNGYVHADVTGSDFTELLQHMEENKESMVVFDLGDTNEQSGTRFTLARDGANLIAKEGVGITIKSSNSSMAIDSIALAEIIKQSPSESILFEARALASQELPEALRQVVKDRPVYEFNIYAGNRTISNFGKGKIKVNLPYKIEPDHHRDAIVVYYLRDSGELQSVMGSYDEGSGTVTFTTNHFSKYMVASNFVSFQDVQEQHWYHRAVTFLAAREIVLGNGDGRFEHRQEVTRAEFLVMLMRAFQIEPEPSLGALDNFDDAGDRYYSPYVGTAKKYGLITGAGDNRYHPEMPVSRQDMMVMLYNVLAFTGRLPEVTTDSDMDRYEDSDSVSDYAREQVRVLVQADVVRGTDNKLHPMKSANRGEAAQIIFNYLSRY